MRRNLLKHLTKLIPLKVVIISLFCIIFAMSFIFLLLLKCATKVSEIYDMTSQTQIIVAQ